MDRTSWIVVTLCSLGLVAWFLTRPPVPVKPPAAPQVVDATGSGTPAAAKPEAAPGTPAAPAAAPAPATAPAAPEKTFSVDDDNIKFTFSNHGGGIRNVVLPPHRFASDAPEVLNEFGLASIGSLGRGAGNRETEAYELKSPEGATPVVYERTGPDGVTVTKTWTMVTEGPAKGFLWKLDIALKNTGTVPVTGDWFLYTGAANPVDSSGGQTGMTSVVWNADSGSDEVLVGKFAGGGIIFKDAPFTILEKSFPQMLWGGVKSQFYTTLINSTKPAAEIPAGKLWAKSVEMKDFKGADPKSTTPVHAIEAAVSLPALNLAAGAEIKHQYEVYVGPRANSILAGSGAYRREVMFYGWFGIISRIMMWGLTHIQDLLASVKFSWGWAIIILTLIVRFIMWPVTLKSTRQMKRMSLLSPKMKEIQEKYKDDPTRMNREVMLLYKRYGVNPVGSCLPMFLQIPIFFGLYRMLQNGVELRGQDWMWVKDLSMPDTQGHFMGYAVNPLPLVMAATMFIQMLMTPKSADPQMQSQQKMFLIMPFMFLFACYNFASALALYWTVSNLVGILQSYLGNKINADVELKPVSDVEVLPPVGKSGKPGSKEKAGFLEIFMQRLEAKGKLAAEAQAKKKRPPRTGG